MIRPKQLSRLGLFYLHEAVLDVLCEHHQSGYGLGPAGISEHAGIYRKQGKGGLNDAIVTGCLNELYDQGKVERKAQKNGQPGWGLSKEEYERRR